MIIMIIAIITSIIIINIIETQVYPLQRTSPSPTLDSETYDEDEEGETEATCGECGNILGPGWQCESCRRSCPYCNRALTTDPNDYCERCFRYCDKHDIIYLIVNSETQEGPKCPECRKAQEEEKE